MSRSGDDGERPERAAFKLLERTVGDALESLQKLRARAEEAEGHSEELQEVVKRFTEDEAAAGRLLTKLRTLEGENADLRDRLEKGRQGVERLLAKIRFLEEQR